LRERVEVRRDEVIINLIEAFEPERRELIQDCALVRNRVGQNHVERRQTIGRDEEQRLAEIKHFAHFSAAQLFYPGEIN